MVDDELHLELPVAGGPVHGDEGGEYADEEEDQHHVFSKPNVLGRHNIHSVHTGV